MAPGNSSTDAERKVFTASWANCLLGGRQENYKFTCPLPLASERETKRLARSEVRGEWTEELFPFASNQQSKASPRAD